ncbi:MAG: hypothetical protein ABI837_18905, partial [Acidobacteriota bacterium]
PRLGRAGDLLHMSIVYQAYKSNLVVQGLSETSRLIRIHKTVLSPQNGTVIFAAMNGFGGLGINPTEFAYYQVLGIDPGNAFHIIAPDVVNQRMMETRDGGENWTEVPGLTNLVTDSGRFLFRTDLIGFGWGTIFPIVTAVSFSPQDPRLVLVGTSEGGIFASNDNGAHWGKISGSERATYITSFFWKNANEVHVSTYGRGLWKLRNIRIAVPPAFDELCPTCGVVSNDAGPGRPPFAGGVLVFEGIVLGAKTNNGQLSEVFVTPGSSVIFLGDQDGPQKDIAITEAGPKDVDPAGLEPLPKGPDGWIVTGLVFGEGNKLTGTVFVDSEMTLLPPVSFEMVGGSTESPTRGTPYVSLTSDDFRGVAAVLPNEKFELAGSDFAAGTYEVFIDGVSTKLSVAADRTGSFKTSVAAPSTLGFHRVDVRPGGDGKTVIDGSTVLVKHSD